MALNIVAPPYPVFTDRDGTPLENGFVYLGVPGFNPETNPIEVFWDESLTIPAPQPIRTVYGYLSRNGTPAKLYANRTYSITVKNIKQEVVFSALSNVVSDPTVGRVDVETFTGDGTTTQFTMSAPPLAENNTQVYINGVYQNKDGYTLSGSILTFSEAPPAAGSNIEVVSIENIVIGEADASNVQYEPAGVGAQVTTVQAKLRETVSVKDFGAVGDGVADDTAAIQAALDTGKDVFVPGTSDYYLLTAELQLNNNQTIFGDGYNSQIRQTTTLLNVVTASNKTNCCVDSLHLYCIGDYSNLSNGCGVYYTGCSFSFVKNCIVENFRGWGVTLQSSNDCSVINNKFINAAVSGAVDDTDVGGDIQAIYGSSRNIISNNHCFSGSGTAIKVQSVIDGDHGDDNIITNNVIKNYKGYGIVAYRNAQNAASVLLQSVLRTVISNNTIENITGELLNSITGTYTYGAGIYLQGAEESAVTGNTITKTHSAAVSFSSLLAPGAIGITNLSKAVVTGNSISDSGVNGMDIGDANGFGNVTSGGVATPGGVGGAVTITGNNIFNSTLRGIRSRTLSNVIIDGNVINTCGSNGVEVNLNTTVVCYNNTISNNVVRNATGTGLNIHYINELVASGNTIDTTNVHGITAANSTNVSVKSNTVKNAQVRGIQIASTCTKAMVCDNQIVGAGATNEGIRLDADTFYDNNQFIDCTSAYVGDFAPFRTLTVNSATPSVTDGKYFITNNSSATTITNFTDGQDGQTVFVVFTDANTTLKFSGVTNLRGNGGVDRAMGVNDAIQATYRRSNFVWYVDVIAAS